MKNIRAFHLVSLSTLTRDSVNIDVLVNKLGNCVIAAQTNSLRILERGRFCAADVVTKNVIALYKADKIKNQRKYITFLELLLEIEFVGLSLEHYKTMANVFQINWLDFLRRNAEKIVDNENLLFSLCKYDQLAYFMPNIRGLDQQRKTAIYTQLMLDLLHIGRISDLKLLHVQDPSLFTFLLTTINEPIFLKYKPLIVAGCANGFPIEYNLICEFDFIPIKDNNQISHVAALLALAALASKSERSYFRPVFTDSFINFACDLIDTRSLPSLEGIVIPFLEYSDHCLAGAIRVKNGKLDILVLDGLGNEYTASHLRAQIESSDDDDNDDIEEFTLPTIDELFDPEYAVHINELYIPDFKRQHSVNTCFMFALNDVREIYRAVVNKEEIFANQLPLRFARTLESVAKINKICNDESLQEKLNAPSNKRGETMRTTLTKHFELTLQFSLQKTPPNETLPFKYQNKIITHKLESLFVKIMQYLRVTSSEQIRQDMEKFCAGGFSLINPMEQFVPQSSRSESTYYQVKRDTNNFVLCERSRYEELVNQCSFRQGSSDKPYPEYALTQNELDLLLDDASPTSNSTTSSSKKLKVG